MTSLSKTTFAGASTLAALAGALAFAAFQVGAQTAAPASDGLSLGEIESKLTAQGITIREVELRDRVVEVEGRDAKGVKVELLMDRKTGEILSQKPDH
jgi:Peptidase propeptide and YPEB domain